MRRGTFLVLLILAGGCHRREPVNELDVPGLCPKRTWNQPRGGQMRIDRDAPPGTFRGRVVAMDTRAPIRFAEVFLRGPDSARAVTDSTGAFEITGLHTGRHNLVARAFPFALRQDTITVSSIGATVEIPMEPVTIDGPCSGFAVYVRPKPWWKFW